MRNLLPAVLGLLLAAASAGCSLGLDESLIPSDNPPADAAVGDAVAEDVSASDGPSSEGDVSLETAKDVSTDPVQEGETGGQDAKSEATDAQSEGDGGCSATPDSGACVVCMYTKCCTLIAACKAAPACSTALGLYESCENAGGPGGCAQLTQFGGNQGQDLQACISQACTECH